MNKNKTFGVIGVCGANGNLIARVLKQRGYNVIGTDLTFKKDCRFAKALEGYDIDVSKKLIILFRLQACQRILKF